MTVGGVARLNVTKVFTAGHSIARRPGNRLPTKFGPRARCVDAWQEMTYRRANMTARHPRLCIRVPDQAANRLAEPQKKLRAPLLLLLAFFPAPRAFSQSAATPSPSPQTAGAPNSAQYVCPLSDDQTQKAIAKWASVASAFSGEDRCANCHGGVDAFSENGHHAGGARDNRFGSRKPCQECHGGLPGWNTPSEEMFFVDGYHQPRKASIICKQIRRFHHTGESFVMHIKTNTDALADFNSAAFAGTRGLNDYGKMFAYTDPYRDLKPSISREEMTKRAEDFVEAMGGEFKGDESCGCEPQHYAVRVSYDQEINLVARGTKTMGPIDIPITFQDDGSYQGEQTIFINGNAVALQCTSASLATMVLRVTGNVREDPKNHRMHLQLESGSPLRGNASAVCPYASKTGSFAANSQSTLERELTGTVGETALFQFGSPGMPINTMVFAKIVKVGAP